MDIQGLHTTIVTRDSLLKKLAQEELFQRSINIYTNKDREIISYFFHEFVNIFQQLRLFVSIKTSSSLDTFAIRYIAVQNYFYTLSKIYEIVWSHREYIEGYIDENHNKSIWKIKKYLMSMKFRRYKHIPTVFIVILQRQCSKEVTKLFSYNYSFDMNLIYQAYEDFMHVSYFGKQYFQQAKLYIVQKVGMFLASIKLKRKKWWMITEELIQKISTKLEPWDIIVTRWNWNATNASIPGFWKHMSMYIGDWDIIESVGTGIHKITLWDMAKYNDYLVVFRTNFSKKKIEQAVDFVGRQIWKEYDFCFNYHSNTSMVCSELVTKAFLPEFQTDEWLDIELQMIWGSLSYPPNIFVQKAMKECNTEKKQLEPILFIDASEKEEKSYLEDIHVLHDSYKRSRWSILQK